MTPVAQQLGFVLMTMGLGLLTGLLYDIYTALYRWRKPRRSRRWVWDISFWFVMFLLVYGFLIRLFWGQVRLWNLLALGLGQLLYHFFWRRNKKILLFKENLAGLRKRPANK